MSLYQLPRRLLRACGLDVVRYRPPVEPPLPPDLSEGELSIVRQIAPFSMTGVDRQVALIQAVRHLVRTGIDGSFVECGVWRGGSTMAMALTLIQEGHADRDLYLFDTFNGMTPPMTIDAAVADGTPALVHLDADQARAGYVWAVASLEEVQANLAATGYPPQRIHYVQGPVEQTLPARAPTAPIALLRLDTDWYESTRQELQCLYPLVPSGGVVIVDDYGHWQGARAAVDEYFAGTIPPPYFHRIDYTGRLLVKP